VKKSIAVARWEYLEKVKSKAFLISLILMPIIMIGMGVVPSLFVNKPDTEPRAIGVIDPGGNFFSTLEQRIGEKHILPDGQPNYVLRKIDLGGGIEEAKRTADRMILAGEVEGYFVLPASTGLDEVVEYRAMNVGNLRLTERFSSELQDIIFEKRLVEAGIDALLVRNISKSVDVKTVKISTTGEEEESGFTQVFFTAYIFIMMMFFLVVTSGQLLVRSVVEEKTNRVVEILVSSCTATELMAGKIIGLSGLGLTQVVVWGLIAVTLSLKVGLVFISLPNALLLVVFFVLGYLLYAAIFVAAGSPISTEQEAQQITTYLVLILVLPVVIALPVMQNPDALFVKILTFIPLLTPTMMALRIPIQMPSGIEIIGGVIILAVSSALAMWVAGRIFRTAILAYGKRPSIRELIQLLRTAH
jgi:ABC-2 type transport system permease protein